MARKSNFSEKQILDAVHEVEAGAKQADVARKVGITTQTLMRWRAKYSGTTANEAAERKRVEDENR
jgi:putative transposase